MKVPWGFYTGIVINLVNFMSYTGEVHHPIHLGRQSTCGTKTKGSYDTGIHVLALIIILALSTLGMRPNFMAGWMYVLDMG